MTAEEMRAKLERAYTAAVKKIAPRAKVGQAIPVGETPLAFSYVIPASAEELDAKAFMGLYGTRVADELAAAGAGETHRCTSFASLRVEDRPAVKVPSMGGRGIDRKRERAFVVHALAWGHKVPEYVHEPVWPHAIGDAVPATSKGKL